MALYDRQERLNLKIPEKVFVLGCGGIGSWVGLGFALTGVSKIYLWDHDIVEETNLNRTPYKTSDIKRLKVEALKDLILERRSFTEVYTYVTKLNSREDLEIIKIVNPDYLIDCRDNILFKKELKKIVKYVKLGYNGYNFTIDFSKEVWSASDEDAGYTIIPSWLGTPMLLTSLIIYIIEGSDLKELNMSGNFEKLINTINNIKGGNL